MRLVFVLFVLESGLYAAVAPLLPHYAHLLGLSKPAAGVLTATYSGGLIAGSLIGGWLAARLGVRRTTLIGLGLLAASSVAFGFGRDIAVLDGLRAVQGLSSGCVWGGGLTWLVGSTPPERRGWAMGVAMSAAVIGTLIGPVIGTLSVLLSTQAVFTTVGLMAGCLMIPVLAVPVPPAQPDTGDRSALSALLSYWPLTVGAWIIALEAMAWGSVGALIPLRLAHLGAGKIAIGAVFFTSSAVAALAAPALGRLSDRRDPIKTIRAGMLPAAMLLVTLPLAKSAGALGLLTVISIGAVLTAVSVPATALIMQSAQRAGMALTAAAATFNFAFAIGETVGAAAGASLAHATTDVVPFATLAALMIGTLALITLRAGSRGVGAADLSAGRGAAVGRPGQARQLDRQPKSEEVG